MGHVIKKITPELAPFVLFAFMLLLLQNFIIKFMLWQPVNKYFSSNNGNGSVVNTLPKTEWQTCLKKHQYKAYVVEGVVWRRLVFINEVNLRRARLVLGWVTVSGSVPGAGHLSRYVTSHPGQLSLAIHSWVGAMSTSRRAVTPRGWGVNAGMVRVWVAG